MSRNPFKPISISLSPNVSKDDLWIALKMLFIPWKWKEGDFSSDFERVFREFFDVKHAAAFNSGRSALFALLSSFRIGEGDQVAVQAFTCSAAIAPILWIGAKPLYIDVAEETLSMDPHDLEAKLTSRVKAIIVQHTFGVSSDIERIMDIARQREIPVIEDCAHTIGNSVHGKKLGTFGDAAFFSFGRDKVISSVYGGMAICFQHKAGKNLRHFSEQLSLPSRFWIFQQIIHPLLFAFLLPIYSFFHLGKVLLVLFQKLGLLSLAVSKIERTAGKPLYFPAKLPNALAGLALHQFGKLELLERHRVEISDMYTEHLSELRMRLPMKKQGETLLRYSVMTPRAHEILKKAWKRGFLLGDWYTQVISPDSTDLAAFLYKNGSCPVAQRMAESILNLPTHINTTREQAMEIVRFLKEK
ncbi:DegT/DnrJ/EryC1/StrS family aminotransferase [Candidatus Peregrinibacteria bacterium]|nr:DegT/DnrJ/EryC1/StrS family aminotransferase [Candidatus Peregrinibacteria bacterium]